MKKVNVGILGTGFVQSVFHMPSYREITDANIVAVGGREKKQVGEFAKKWSVKKAFWGKDFIEKLCKTSEVDVVDIGLPNFLHKEAVVSAAERGKHVICEKPLGFDSRVAETMLRSVKKAGVIHCYGENQLFIPQVARSKRMIENDAIGRVFWVKSREAHFGPHSPWFWKKASAGGGVLMDMGCHSIEVARYLMGKKKPREAFAWGATLVHDTEVEDNSLALLRYDEGKLTESENSWSARGGVDRRFEVYGSDGVILMDPMRETGLKVFTVAPEDKVGYIVEKADAKQGWMYPVSREHEVHGFLFELQHFISCIRAGETPIETFEDGYLVNRILDSCYKSIGTKKWEAV